MLNLTLEIDEQPHVEDFRFLLDGVRAFNRTRTGNEAPRQVACYLRDQTGQIIAGAQGSLWGRSMHIDVLWVDDAHRGQNHGTKIMQAIEEYAVTHNHPLLYLETTSFQALPFYQGLGYVVFGELEGISAGHSLYFLKKEIQR